MHWRNFALLAGAALLGFTAGCTQKAADASAESARPADFPTAAQHYFVPKGAGKTYNRDGLVSESKLTADMSEGRYSIQDEIWHPGFVVEPHFHVEHAEAFYVLGGHVQWTVGGETRTLGPGDQVYIPPNTVHSVKVVGNEDEHSLMLQVPGGYEDHMEEEATYSPEQRKQQEVIDLMRSHYDFNPFKGPMPKRASKPEPDLSKDTKHVVRPVVTTPSPDRSHFIMYNKGETFHSPDEDSEVTLTSADTEGRYTFLDEIWKPGMNVPPHYHKRKAEVFYVIDGTVEWTIGGETHDVTSGGLVYIPPNTVHTVKVVGNTPEHSLMISYPGGYEYYSRASAPYTEDQLKQHPEIQKRLRVIEDFHPVSRAK